MSRFLRFFSALVVVVVGALYGASLYSATSSGSTPSTTIYLDDDGAKYPSVPSTLSYNSSTHQLSGLPLTSTPYKPGYLYAGHFSQAGCEGSAKIMADGSLVARGTSGNNSTETWYACWVPAIYLDPPASREYQKVFVLNGNGGTVSGCFFGGCGRDIYFFGSATNTGGRIFNVKYENRGDWVFWARNTINYGHSWLYPTGSNTFGVTTVITPMPFKQGSTFDGYYDPDYMGVSIGRIVYSSQALIDADALPYDIEGMFAGWYNEIYAKWNPVVYTVTFNDTYASPNPVYFDGTSWYSDSNATQPITSISVAQNGNLTFNGYFTGQNGTGTQIVYGDGALGTGAEVVNAIQYHYDGVTLYSDWSNPVWATLSLNDQGATVLSSLAVGGSFNTVTFINALYNSITACSTPGYRASQNCSGSVISKINPPTKNGWTYKGHWTGQSGNGTQYIDDDGNLSSIRSDTEVFAKWMFSVTYDGNGNTGGSAPSGPNTCVYGTECRAPSSSYTKTGSVFNGWNCQLMSGDTVLTGYSCYNSIYYANDDISAATNGVSGATGIKLTARWTSQGSTCSRVRLVSGSTSPYIYQNGVSFFADRQCTNEITGSIFDLSNIGQPTNYENFSGYWTSQTAGVGTRAINRQGYIVVSPSQLDGANVLYAQWPTKEEVSLDKGSGGTWGNCSTRTILVAGGLALPEIDCGPTPSSGYQFDGYYDDETGVQYYNGQLVAQREEWPIEDAPNTLVAHYSQIPIQICTVNYYCELGAANPVYTEEQPCNAILVWNGALCNSQATQSELGYKVDYWRFSSGSGMFIPGHIIVNEGMTTINWYAHKAEIHHVTMDHCGNYNCDTYPLSNNPEPDVVYYSNCYDCAYAWYSDAGASTPIRAMYSKPIRSGFDLQGYYTGEAGVVNYAGNFSNSLVSVGQTTSFATVARWQPTLYEIRLNPGSGNGGTEGLYYRIDKGWDDENDFVSPTNIMTITKPTPPTSQIFLGYYTMDGTSSGEWGTQVVDGTGTILVNGFVNVANMVASLSNGTIYARYEQVTPPSNPNEYFAVTTTAMSAGQSFTFGMSAAGTFYVDWGDETIDVIDRSTYDQAAQKYSHTYTTASGNNGWTIKIWGEATGYKTWTAATQGSAISFGSFQGANIVNPDVPMTPERVAGISGSLGAVFPTVNGGGDASKVPGFYGTFYGCTNLTGTIPYNLFSGITGNRSNMFRHMFSYTDITSIPANLFNSVSGAADGMFEDTFSDTNITSIPEGLFSGISGAADRMFEGTFSHTNITSIPEGLFSGVSGAADRMFYATFYNTNITSLPHGLFSGVTGTAQDLFTGTFNNCTSLTGYIPKDFFNLDGLVYNPDNNMMLNTFVGFVPDCGSYNLTWYQTDFDSYWNGAKICAPAATFSCAMGPGNPNGTGTAPEPIFWDSDAVTSGSFTLPADAGCVAPEYWTKTNNWTLTVNNVNHYWPVGSAFPGTSPSNSGITWDGQQSINFYMSYQKNIFSVALNKNHNDAQNGSVTTLYEVQGTRWSLNSNGNGEVLSLAPNQLPTHGNLAFDGYYDDPDEGEGNLMVAANGDIVASNTTLTDNSQTWYAHWTTSNGPFTVTFSCGDDGSWASGVTPSTFTPQSDVYYNDPQHMLTVPAFAVCTHNPGTNNHDDQGYTNTAWLCHFANTSGAVVFGGNPQGYTTQYLYHDHLNCVPSWVPVETTITLDPQLGSAGTYDPWNTGGGTDTIYTRYDVGAFLDAGRTQQMGANQNGLPSLPGKSVLMIFDLNADDAVLAVGTSQYKNLGTYSSLTALQNAHPTAQSGNYAFVGNQYYIWSSTGTNPGWYQFDWPVPPFYSVMNTLPFKGYYPTVSGGIRYISPSGLLETAGNNAATQSTSNSTWHAQWQAVNPKKSSFDLQNLSDGLNSLVPTRAGKVFAGWWTEASGGQQVTQDENGNLILGGDENLSLTQNITLYAHWTECEHTLPAGSHSSMQGISSQQPGYCSYHITCDAPGYGYSQHGGNDTTGEFNVSVSGTTGTLEGGNCYPRVYSIDYGNLANHNATMPENAPGQYTYGVETEINVNNATPTSPTDVFESWCWDAAGTDHCNTTQTISNTAYGDKVYYAKWSNACQPGYTKYNFETTPSLTYTGSGGAYTGPNNGVSGPGVSPQTCVPIRYHINCNKNCDGDTCAACLEDFYMSCNPYGGATPAHWHLGGGYNVKDFYATQTEFFTNYDGGFAPVKANPSHSWTTLPDNFMAKIGYVESGYDWCALGAEWNVFASMYSEPGDLYGAQRNWYSGNYVHFLQETAQNGNNPNTSFGRAHYTFDGLWTAATGGKQYIDGNGNFANGDLPGYDYVPWPNYAYNGYDVAARQFQNFFFDNGITPSSTSPYTFDVYAHWIPDVYSVKLMKNDGTNTQVGNIYEEYGNGWAINVSGPFNPNLQLSGGNLPSRSGYTFAGYYTQAEGGDLVGSFSNGVWTLPTNTKYLTQDGGKWYAHWTPEEHEVTLDRNLGNATGTNGSTKVYTKYATGVYKNSGRTQKMTPNPNGTNPITLPTRKYVITYNPNYTGGSTWTFDVSSTFNGYYSSATGGTPYIDNTGYITPTGDSTAQGYTVNTKKWYAQWTNGWHDLLLAHRNGYFMNGWYDAAENGNLVGGFMQTITPTSNMTLYAQWTACNWTAGDHSTAQYVNPVETDLNVCKYHITCESGYTHNGDSQFDEVKYSASGTLPECSANEYTITYYDNPAYETTSGQHILLDTQGYTYNPNNPVVLNPELPSNALSDHHASSVQWCDIDGNNCKTQLAAGETGNKTFYAKWTCATGYTTYGYFTQAIQYDDGHHDFSPGMCAPIRYRVMCNRNCPATDQNCTACLEDFNMPDNQGSGYSWGNSYNSVSIFYTEFNIGRLPIPVKLVSYTPVWPSNFTQNPDYETIGIGPTWPDSLIDDVNGPNILWEAWQEDKNYKTFMEELASKSYNSNINFGAVHYDFDGLWTAANGGEQYIRADGLSPTGGGAFDTQEMSTFFTSDTNVYAHWIPKKYQVVLDKNASDAVAGNVVELWEKWNDGWALTQDGTYNSAQTLSGNQLPRRTGYTFAGYFDTNAETGGNAMGSVSNGVWTTPSATATDVNPTKWYARWTPNQYTVTYDCGIGSGNGLTDNAPRYGQPYTPKTYAAAGCERPSNGYYFNGWNVTPGHSNSDIKNAGEAFNWDYTENQTFTARWVAKEYHITFNKNGGSGGTDEVWERYDSFWHDAGQNHITTITLPNWSGHTFAGYAFNGNTVISETTLPEQPTFDFGDDSNNSTVDITLVAQWDMSTYNITYDENGGSRGLPTGYTLLEYLDTTNAAGPYINTGIAYDSTKEIIVNVAAQSGVTPSSNLVVLGLGSSTGQWFGVSSSGKWTIGSGGISNISALNKTSDIEIKWNGGTEYLTIGGAAIGSRTISSGGMLNLFGRSGAGTFKGKIYFAQIIVDGVVVRNFMPAKNSSNVVGMYDTVTKTFFTNAASSGSFVAGGTVTQNTDAYPESYTYGVGAKVYGVPTRAHSVFDGWCGTENSSGGLSNCQTTMPYTISTTAMGDKTLHAKWSCETGYTQSSNKQSCVANNITLDWNENGGIGLTNGSCTYNGDLTLGVAPTYADHVFNGWKTYGTSGIFAANTSITGGCTDTYTGVTSGTSTAITAQWCPACSTTNASCTPDMSVPGTCSYETHCNAGYHLDPNSQLNVYNTVCIPYTITYDANGHGSGATQEVLYNNGNFVTNNAMDATQFSWANHIVKDWDRISGGTQTFNAHQHSGTNQYYADVNETYAAYLDQGDTTLRADWGECHCTLGDYVANCVTTSLNNACEVSEVECETGHSGGTGSCEGLECTSTCGESYTHMIRLIPRPATDGTRVLYAIDTNGGTDAGVYLDVAHQQRMTENDNHITLPTPVTRTVTYDKNANDAVLVGNTTAQTSATFNGYYNSTSGTEQYIAATGYITSEGITEGTEAANHVWSAQWTNGTVVLPCVYRPGYKFLGWFTATGTTPVGQCGDTYSVSASPTLYAHWELCADGEYCPGVETVNNQTVYNAVHDCPENYPNSAAGSTIISDCYLVLTPGKWVETAGAGMVDCTENYYCDDNTTKVYYSGDGRRTTGIRKSCAANAGSFSLSSAASDEIGDCYKNVTLNKRGGSGTLGGASGTANGSEECHYGQNCTLPNATVLQLVGHTFHGGWSQTDEDCDGTTRVFVVPDDVDTYYACRTTNSYTVTLKDGQNTGVTFATVNVNYGDPMPNVDSNGNSLVVPTHTPISPNTTHVFQGYFSTSGQSSGSGTLYYNANLTSARNWTTENDGTLYAKWYMKCDPGYYLPAGSYACALCPAGRYCVGGSAFAYSSSTDKGLSGYIAAGYYSTGGASTSKPSGHVTSGSGCYGQVNGADTACGLVAGGYYSTGGGTSATPTAAGNGCLSGSGRSCGVLGANYYSNGGGTNNAGACVTGQTCGACPTNYRSNSATGKTAITQCTAGCSDGQWIMTAENPTVNNPSAEGCTTSASNYIWSKAHTVAYGSASPSVSDPNEGGRHSCQTLYRTPTTYNASDHDDQSDCTRSVPLFKNGGATVDGAVWPDNVTDDGGTDNASATCAEGATCNFGNPAELLEQTGHTFQANWGTNAGCTSTVGTSVTTPTNLRYYACKTQNNYTLTYSCGTGTGTAPAQQTNIHYGDTVSVSGAGNCAKTGHTFAGWAVSDTSDVITATTWPHDITWNYDGSKTFTAQWTANTYSISYVGNGGTAASLLPDGYTQLEYIQSDGNQYIRTNFIPSSDFKHTIVFEGLSGNSSTYIAGTNSGAAGRAGNVRIDGNYINAVYGNNASDGAVNLVRSSAVGSVSILNKKSVLVLDLHNNATNSMTLNGVQIANTSTARITSTSPMSLFALNSSYRSIIRLYRDTIEQNGVLVHNYVPAQRDADNEIGLYDTVTGEFFTNRGSGAFVAEDPVTTTEPYPNQYTYGVGATVTGGAARANSVFQAWCRTASLTNCAAPHEITTTDTGDITLYAKWGCVAGYHDVDNQCVANEFTLVYNANGHDVAHQPGNQTCTYGQQINLAGDLSETGWWFNGWTIAGETYMGGETITCNEEYLGVTGGTVSVNVNVVADWSAKCNKITLNKNNSGASNGTITALYAKTRENGSAVDGKWYKNSTCTTEYTSADYANVIPTRSDGWTFRGFYANLSDAADINATQTNGANRVITHTGTPTSITGQNFINNLNAPATLYAGWAKDCAGVNGTCVRTLGTNTSYTTSCATGYHYGTAPNGVTYNPATNGNTSESTYYPNCVPNTITIILDKNGGTGTCGGQSGTTSGTLTCAYDDTCNTPTWTNTCKPSKTGKIFAGWNTETDGTGTQYGTATVAGDVQNINDGTTTTTLYAVWQDAVCNVTNGSATVAIRGNQPYCRVTCDTGYEQNGVVGGQQHEWIVNTGQCNAATYDIDYELYGGSRVEPNGYTLLEYVTADGNQYIDTGIAIKKSYEIRSNFEPKISAKFLYGVRNTNDTSSVTMYISDGGNSRWGNQSLTKPLFINTEYTTVHNVSGLTVNGTTTAYTTQSVDFTTTNTLILGTARAASGTLSSNKFIGNIYEFRILDGNRNDLMNLVPMMRNSDGIAGLYDTVSGTFFTSTSGTAFIAGPRVSNAPEGYTFLDYIESDGNQKINTGIMGLNKRVVLDAQYTGTSVSSYKIPVGYYGDYLGTYMGVYNNKWAVYSSQTVGTATNRTIFSVVFDMNGEKNRATLTVDGTTKTYTRSNAQPDATLKLFTSCSSSGAGSYGFIGRIYSARIYDKDTNELLFDGVPARQDSDGALGVYDMVSGDFFPNIAEGTFVAGPSINGAYPEHYTYGVGANVYGVPVRANSVFEGWCRNAELTDGCTMVPHTIGATETGDKLLHAKWSCVDGYHLGANNQCVGNTITINYQNGGHGGNPWNPQTCIYGTQTNLGGAMFDSGYVFSGWELNDEVYDAEENISCNYDTLGVYSGSVAAVAVWDAQAFTVTYDCNTSWTPNNAPASQNTQTDAQFTVKSNTCVNPGYRFVKWAVSGTNPQEYKNENDQFIWGYTENKTFSAVWEIDDTDAFTVTVDMPANTEFKFNTIATGQFWVNWDDGSNIEEYAPTTITTKTWTHTYTTAGTYDIKIGGRATGYAVSGDGTPEKKSAISFFNGTLSDSTSIDATVTASGTEQYITAVSGKLGAIFPTITAGSWGGQPRFYRTFKNTTAMTVSLQSIADLFDGISGVPVHYMFAETFDGSAVTGAIPAGLFPVSGAPKTALFLSSFRNCTGLTGTIPANLFVNISGAPAVSMFSRTFRGCTGLTGIPAGLFRNISGAPAEAMFYATFLGCTNITGTLSSNLFGSLNGPIAKDMFRSTFYNCTSLVGDASDSTVAIPNGMFGTLTASTTAATRAFSATFYGCAALRGKIGGALFEGLTGNPAEYMFSNTFNTCGDRDVTTNCSNLNGNIPTNLFGNMTGAPKSNMFNATFKGASKLTGAIPSKLFGTITGAPATSMFKETFKGCSGLTGIIPANLFENISGLPAGSMFYSTFYGCSHLSGIGGALFSGISGRAVSSMFFTTFYNCSGLTGSIPAGLFGTPTTPASWMFGSTFYGCSGLTGEIPSGLFGSVNGAAKEAMFYRTFYNCSGLTGTIPSDLFGTLSGDGVKNMFNYTFYNCSHLTGYVPEGLFGTMTVPSTVPDGMMSYVFVNSGLDTVCPCGTTEVDSDFKPYWRSTSANANPKKVSCRVGLKPGEHWYGNQCTTECSDTAIDELHVGNLNPYVVLADPVSTVKNLAVKHNDTICYVPVASGNGGASSLNMKYGNTVYHADRPNDTPPAGFGQR